MVILGSSSIEGQLSLKVLEGSEVCYISSQGGFQAFGGTSNIWMIGHSSCKNKQSMRSVKPERVERVFLAQHKKEPVIAIWDEDWRTGFSYRRSVGLIFLSCRNPHPGKKVNNSLTITISCIVANKPSHLKVAMCWVGWEKCPFFRGLTPTLIDT